MTLRRRILFYYAVALGFSLLIVWGLSWFEFSEQRRIVLSGGIEAALEESPLEEAFEIILYGGLPALLLGVFGVAILMRRVLRPIEEFTVALERTDVTNLAEPVPRNGSGDELDRMSAVFNRMKERLGKSFMQAREFTLNASHELKTPLSIMHGMLEQMLTGDTVSPESKDKVASLLEEVQRLTTIVSQLAFLARADAGLLATDLRLVALHDLVSDLAGETAILASGPAITVTLSRLDQVSVTGDRMRLRQLLLNLADNAIKHNEPGGTIDLTLERHHEKAVFTVVNSGPILGPELKERVFERFFRGDLAHSSTVEGSGLGLSIAQSIVEAHQGEIRYEVLPDRHTRVTVSLPAVHGE